MADQFVAYEMGRQNVAVGDVELANRNSRFPHNRIWRFRLGLRT